MQIQNELSKIETILSEGSFEWKGCVWLLDAEATRNENINANLAGKPLRKLVGIGEHGEIIRVWSHDVTTVTRPTGDVVAEPAYVQSDTFEPEVVEVVDDPPEPAPRGRKKTVLKKERVK